MGRRFGRRFGRGYAVRLVEIDNDLIKVGGDIDDGHGSDNDL